MRKDIFMTKKELRIISLKFRTLSSQMLNISSEDEAVHIYIFLDYINKTEFIKGYIDCCHTQDYDFKNILSNKHFGDLLELPQSTEEIVDYCYQLLTYITTNHSSLNGLTLGYDHKQHFSDSIKSFMRKTIGPFVTSIKSYIEIKLIELDDITDDNEKKTTTAFLSYCHKDAKIADIIDEGITQLVSKEVLSITRDIRGVEYHESFKRFMETISDHDFVIMLISDRYLKSSNCLYEVLETIKDRRFSDRLAYIILSNEDSCYLDDPNDIIGANIYTTDGQAEYILFWQNEEQKLNKRITEINNPAATIGLSKELKHIKNIENEISEFIEFLKEYKGIPLKEHIQSNFDQLLHFMKIK